VCLFIFTPEVTVGAFDLSSTSSVLKKELLKIGKIHLFSVDGYKVQRRDRNQYGGGLLTFIRSDFSSSRKQSLESEKIETLCVCLYLHRK
jgi:hypothetical protein